MTTSERFGPDLLRGSLDLVVLTVLASGKTYGYELQQRVRQASGELLQLQAGTLYPLLHRLEADGLISSLWDSETGRKRKWYELTLHGHKKLVSQASQWDKYVECIQELLAPLRTGLLKPV